MGTPQGCVMKSIRVIHQQTLKTKQQNNREWVASLPTRRRNVKYKMSPFVTVHVQHEEPGYMQP